MKSYVFVDQEKKLVGKILDDKLIEIKFYDSILGNIYRAKVINKIPAIKGYFLEYEKGKQCFVKSKKDFAIGDNFIGQIVREASNKKLPLMSANFKIESENYFVERFPIKARPKQKGNKNFSKEEYNKLFERKNKLLEEENFFPTPKLLYQVDSKEKYLEENSNLEVKYLDIYQDSLVNEGLKVLATNKIYEGETSIIIDELESLTVIDVNSSKKKSTSDKNIFFDGINRGLFESIAYQIKLRNIGGMVVVDFLRSENLTNFEEDFAKALEKYSLDYEIYGFTNMGLFELSIKRRGESLTKELKKREIIK